MVECLLNMHKAVVQFPAPHNLGMVLLVIPTFGRLEVGESEVWIHSWLHRVRDQPELCETVLKKCFISTCMYMCVCVQVIAINMM